MECYSVLKRNKLLSHGKICRNFKCISKWKEPGCILYDSNSVTFRKRQNHGDRRPVDVRDCGGCRWQEGWDEQSMEDF